MANLGYLQLTRNCLQHCRFCSNPPTGVDLSIEEMRELIDGLAEMDYDGVILTGGEPSMSPLLFPALEYAHSKGLHSRMITNGQLLEDKIFFQEAVDAGLNHIHVSLHSYRPEVHDFITAYPRAWETLVGCLSHVPEMGITADINTVINAYNCDHLHETVIWLCDRFPFIRHFVWNNMDPDGNRTEDHPDCIPMHHEFQVSLDLAMEYLTRTGRTFRAERVPLCAGMYSMAKSYNERELSPIFEDPDAVIRQVLGREPEPALLKRIAARKGRRSRTEQPTDAQRQEFRPRDHSLGTLRLADGAGSP
jgi:MoaA/NifB/PqqE/SkfB family radical SAM enzyme